MTQKRADFELDTPIDQTFHQKESEKVRRWESTLPPGYWEYRRKWEENPKNHVVGPFPVHLDAEATSACNLKCTMCPRTARHGAVRRDTPLCQMPGGEIRGAWGQR